VWIEKSLSNQFVILCADDEPTALTVRRLLLSTAGYTVLTASSVAGTLNLCSRNHVDLVITTPLLAEGNGVELISEVKQLNPDVPVVLLTGLTEPPHGFQKANLILSRGMMPRDFLAAIAQLLSTVRPVRGIPS
jgi:CheY-like chemotaxis protein